MMLAIRALAWEILARYRWLLGGSAVCLLASCVVAALLPESARIRAVGSLLLPPGVIGLGVFVLAVTYGSETRLDTRAGEFPRRLLLPPVSAGLLAGVPLALALGVPSLVWMVAAVGILRSCGAAVPIFWPGLYLGVMLAWLLALCWSPMPLRWARLAIICVVLAFFFFAAGLLANFTLPEYAILLGLAVLGRIAVGLAVRGVARSRCEGGESSETAALSPPREGVSIVPFRSRLRAQLWLEWRTHGLLLAILTFALGLFFIAAVAMTEHRLRTDPDLFRLIFSNSLRNLGPAWLGLSWLLIIPAVLAGVSGGEMGKFAQRQKSFQVPAFVGLLPVSTGGLVRGKFIAVAIHLALMWGILVALALGWAVIGGHASDMAERLTVVCGSPALSWLTLLATLLSAYLITYLICVGSMWGGLFGSPLLAPLPAVLGTLEIILAVVIASSWEPGYGPMLLSGLWVAFAGKLLLAEYLLYYDHKRVHVGWMRLSVALLMWAAITAVPAWTAAWLLGDATAALAVVVLSPLVSCLATPAVLHRSRHGVWA